MRVTKTRIMRKKTINPNPPICRSKEPSFTFLTIYSCQTNEVINRIEHYNWNLTQAEAAANGGQGTYTKGYFYETAFKKYHDLSQDHCLGFNYFEIGPWDDPIFNVYFKWNAYQKHTNVYDFQAGFVPVMNNGNYPAGWDISIIEIDWYNPTAGSLTVSAVINGEDAAILPMDVNLITPGTGDPATYELVIQTTPPPET